jgi:hypothetical protein
MANYYSNQYQDAYVDQPSEKLDVGYMGAVIRRFYAEYTKPTGAELLTTDVLYLGKLPKGARVIDGRVVGETDGTTGQFNVGWLSNGSDAADADGFFAGATEFDVGAAAVNNRMLGVSAGYNKKFAAETDVVLVPAEATTAYDAKKLSVELHYVLD